MTRILNIKDIQGVFILGEVCQQNHVVNSKHVVSKMAKGFRGFRGSRGFRGFRGFNFPMQTMQDTLQDGKTGLLHLRIHKIQRIY